MPLTIAPGARGTRTPAPSRSRTPSGQLREVGRAYADDPRPTPAELVAPLAFGHDRVLPCERVDPETFFPVGHAAMNADAREQYAQRVRFAKGICQPCPVRVACRDYAITSHQAGIWGGTDEDERRQLRKQRRIA
jgi:WhiB family transcriptional regulator, redox-sensing transcriptional regulator